MLEAKKIARDSKPAPASEPVISNRQPEVYLTAGEIFRKKLMLTFKGTPQKSRMKVNAVVVKLADHELETPWGMSKAISIKQLNDFNSRMVRLAESRMAYDDFMEHGVIRYNRRNIAKLTPIKYLSTNPN